MLVPIDEVCHFDVTTHVASTGAISDADSAPTYDVFEESTDTPILDDQTMTKRTSLTGNYRGSFTASAANGFEAGKWYSVVVTATVSSVTAKAVAMHFRCAPAETSAGVPKGDVSHWNGTAVTGTVTMGALTVTGTTTMSDGLVVNRSTADSSAIVATGNGTGHGVRAIGGNTGRGLDCVGGTGSPGIRAAGAGGGAGIDVAGGATGHGIAVAGGGTSGNGLQVTTSGGHGANFAAAGSSAHGIRVVGGTGGTSDGISITAGTGGVGVRTDTVTASGTVTFNAFTVTTAITAATVTTSGTVTFSAFTVTNAMTVGTNTIPWNASWDAEVQSEVQDAIEVNHLDHLIAVADPGAIVANSSLLAKLTSKSATPAFSSYDNTTDSLEAIRDRGDAAWTTGSSLTQADVRTAVGLASANLDTQLTAIDDYLDTEVAAIKAKTDQLTFTAANKVDATIQAAGDFAQAAADKVWSTAARTLTAATNITSTGGTITVSSGGVSLAAAGLDAIVIESGINARQALSIIGAACAGVTSGMSTTTATLKGLGVATTRITATIDGSDNRTAITLSPPA